MTNVNRRSLLEMIGGVLVTATAGCTSSSSSSSNDVTVYSVIEEPAMRNTILPAFEEDVSISLVSQAPQEISSRMSSEYQSGTVESDVAINAQGTMQSLQSAGGFRDPGDELLESIEELYPEDAYSAPRLPGFTIPAVVMYNTERVDESELPESYADLTNSRWNDRFAFDDPTALNAAGGQFATLRGELGDDEWRDVMEGIAANNPRITQSASETARVLASGETDLIIGLFNNLISLQEDEPVEGLWLDPTVALNVPTYLSKGSSSPDEAEQFVQWFVSEEGQHAIAQTGRVPAHSGIAEEEFSELIPSNVEILPVAYNDESYYDSPDEWIERFEEIFG